MRSQVAFKFAPGDVVIRVGVSRTDINHARTAFQEEVAGRTFQEVHAATRMKWAHALSVVRVDIQNCDRLRAFYTGLYAGGVSLSASRAHAKRRWSRELNGPHCVHVSE